MNPTVKVNHQPLTQNREDSFYWIFIQDWVALDQIQEDFHIVDLYQARNALNN